MLTVYDAFTASAARTPRADFLCVEATTAQTYGIEEGAIGWGDAAATVEALRAAYAQAGYGHGHRVGLLLENRPAFLFHWVALNALGVSVVPINAQMRAAELEYLIAHSEIGLAVCLPQRAEDLRAAAQRAGVGFQAVALDEVVEFAPPPAAAPAPFAARAIDAQTECALLYTSGTSGRPKG